MAKTKKQPLTAEERLAAALVPENEQPYPVPRNWVWVNIDYVADLLNGFAFKSQNYSEDGIRIIRIGNVQDGYIEDDKPVFYPHSPEIDIEKYLLHENDLLISLTGNVGRVALLQKYMLPAALNQRVACLRELDYNVVSKKYLFFYLLQKKFLLDCVKSSKGSAQLNMSTEWLKDYPLPLPSFPEQQRIVMRIESLFDKLDQAKELVQSALDSFKSRKAAILHRAFTGELTAEWREANGVGLESWENRALGNCGALERGRSTHRPRNAPELFGGSYPFIQTGDVANADVYVTQHKQTLSESGLAQSKLFPKGTLCITIAANIGDVAILSYDSCFPDSVVGFTPSAQTDSKYIYYMMSVLQKKLETEAPATAQKNINLKVLNDVQFLSPTLPEQQEIVRILDSLLDKEHQARELCGVLEKIDLMKKAILARAFRGELGTNDPDEESATGLLRTLSAQIIQP